MADSVMLKNLECLFNPCAVAVVGASANPDKLGFHVMKSLTSGGFKGTIVPVNPGTDSIMGIPAFSSLGDFPGAIDLAVIVLPAKMVPGIFQECSQKGVRGVVLITAGFREIDDPQGAALQNTLADMARKADLPVIGPNTFGMINLQLDLNASFTPEFSLLPKGNIAFVSQSGGVSHLVGFLAMRQNVGFSKIVGLGNRLNVDFPEMIAYLMDDPETRVIALYIEGMDEPRRFLAAMKNARFAKPVVAYKTGNSRTGNQASASHTGSLAGKHEIYAGALKQAGVLQVDSAERLLDTARALALCPLPGGGKVAILTGQAGPGIAAADVCESAGLEIAAFCPETQMLINDLLPPLALRTNPVDMGPAWYNTQAIEGIIGAAMEDDNVDGVLLLMVFASANRDAIAGFSRLLLQWKQKKPVISCLLSPPGIWDEEIRQLEAGGALVNFPTPERAAGALAALWEYRKMSSFEDRI
ncbi:MAG: acetate--CoA ligase family protein [Syntrophales bacterium]